MNRIVLCVVLAAAALAVLAPSGVAAQRSTTTSPVPALEGRAPGICRCESPAPEPAAPARVAEVVQPVGVKSPLRGPRPLAVAVAMVLAGLAGRRALGRPALGQRRTGPAEEWRQRHWSRGPPLATLD